MESRAAVFTSEPQAVEVYEGSTWRPASMLGWRHDREGVCAAWVRLEFAGVVEDAWVELTRLRLPESPARHLTVAEAPGSAGESAVTAGSAPDPAQTQQLPLVRDGEAPSAVQRMLPAGGRRRAPETGEPAALTGTATITAAPLASVPAVPERVPGRHRAPAAAQGRHRAADAGVLTPVSDAAAGSLRSGPPRDGSPGAGDGRWSDPPSRSVLPPAGPVVRQQGGRGLDSEGLTRPMRLDEGVGSARRARRDSLSV